MIVWTTMKVAVTMLVFCVAALMALGLVMLYSSSMAQVGTRFLIAQMIWCGLGMTSAVVMTVMDYRLLRRSWWVLYGLGVVMLGLVLIPKIGPIPLGMVKNGARRWFSMGGMSVQPSELGKVVTLIALAWYGERFQRQMPTWKRGILLPGLLIGLPVGLIFKEPDVGNALVLAAVSGTVLIVAGIRFRYFVPPVLIAVTAVSLFIYHNPMRSQRVYSWLHVEETKQDKGLQAYQSMLALGAGGWTGLGLGNSRQKLGWVPENQTDFILPIIGEELGLVATLLVLAAFLGILICGIYIASRAADIFGLLLGSGITFLIGCQALVNVGVVTSALPNKGLPLPFISYGGSNLLIMMTCIGVLLSIARNARVEEEVSPSVEDEDLGDNPFRPVSASEATARNFKEPQQRSSPFLPQGLRGGAPSRL